jgi:hypothetical protein
MARKRERGVTEVKPSLMPCCGYMVDSASDPNGDATPEPGDFSICLRCGAILQFGPDLTSELPGVGVLEKLRLTEPETWAEMQRLQQAQRHAAKAFGTIPDRGGRS